MLAATATYSKYFADQRTEGSHGATTHAMVRILAFGVLLIGSSLRIFRYFQQPSLWMDEILLSLSVARLSFTELAGPLPFEQVAPVLFLWGQRLSVGALGVSEAALRLIPLACGVALLGVITFVARHLGGWRAALIAVGLASVSPLLLRYSNEAKQYGVEAFVAVAICAGCLAMLGGALTLRRSVVVTVVGLLCIGASLSAMFVLGGAWLALLLAYKAPWDRKAVLAFGMPGVVWPAAFLLLYLLVYSEPATADYMRRFWGDSFLLSGDPSAVLISERALRAPVEAAFGGVFPLPMWSVVTAWFLAAAGGWRIAAVQGWGALAVFIVPFLLVLTASALELYIAGGRLLLFWVPCFLILFALGAVTLADKAPRGGPLILLLLASLTYFPARASWYLVRYPALEMTREQVADLLEHAAPHEPVYVAARALAGWVFYTTDWKSADEARLAELLRNAVAAGPNSGNAPTRGVPVVQEGYDRVWRTDSRIEVLGIASGMENASPPVFVRSTPDIGWGHNEVQRLRNTGSPTAWLFLYHLRASVRTDLLDALHEANGSVLTSFTYGEDTPAVVHIRLDNDMRAPE
jgi:uncharacterized membrane protein